jgi:hypothetical protein
MIIEEEASYYRKPAARVRVSLRDPGPTRAFVNLMRWQSPENLRLNEPLYLRIFASLPGQRL